MVVFGGRRNSSATRLPSPNLGIVNAYLGLALGMMTLVACENGLGNGGDDDIVAGVQATPWRIPLEMGNFEVNGKAVSMWEGSESLSIIRACAPTSQFPSDSLQNFSLAVFIPAHPFPSPYVINLNDVQAHLHHVDGSIDRLIGVVDPLGWRRPTLVLPPATASSSWLPITWETV